MKGRCKVKLSEGVRAMDVARGLAEKRQDIVGLKLTELAQMEVRLEDKWTPTAAALCAIVLMRAVADQLLAALVKTAMQMIEDSYSGIGEIDEDGKEG